MQNSREDSVWRTLAVAFGDGLAFGVGVNLTQNAVRLATGKINPEMKPLAARIAAVEQRIERARANGALPSPHALETRLGELNTRFERSLAELEVKVKIQLDALQQQDRTVREEMAGQMVALRGQMVALHKEFAETVSRLVEEQIEAGVSARMEAIQQTLHEVIQEEAQNASAMVAAATEDFVHAQLAPMREEMAARDARIADLERRIDGRDRNLLELVLALGQTCVDTAERMNVPGNEPPAPAQPPAEAPVVQPPRGGRGAIPAEILIQPAPLEVPAFAIAKPPRMLWRVPFVSSFFAVTCGLLILHYL
jgi:hypothetical protein